MGENCPAFAGKPTWTRALKQMSMLTFSRISGVVLFGLAACLPGSRIGAFEGAEGASVEKAPLQTFATALSHYQIEHVTNLLAC